MSRRSVALAMGLGIFALVCALATPVSAAPTTAPTDSHSSTNNNIVLPSFDLHPQVSATPHPISAELPTDPTPTATAPLPSAVLAGPMMMLVAAGIAWRIRRRGGRI